MEEIKRSVNIGESLADYISSQEYGTIIRFQDIEIITKEKRKTPRYYNAISKAKKILEERGKVIQHIGGGDYQVIFPGDYTNAYIREIRLANGKIKHGGKILQNAPVNDMNSVERQEYRNVSDFNTKLSASLQGSFVEVKRLADHKKHPYEEALSK